MCALPLMKRSKLLLKMHLFSKLKAVMSLHIGVVYLETAMQCNVPWQVEMSEIHYIQDVIASVWQH